MLISRRQALGGISAALTAAALPYGASAQTQSAGAIRFVVPFSAGGGTDVIARIVAEYTSQKLGRPVLVENKPGGGTVIGSQTVARAEPNGLTYLFATSAYSIAQAMNDKLPFDPDRDLEPIMHVASVPMLLMVHPKVPVHNMTELLAYLRANPGKITFGSAGIGSATHMATELFIYASKVKMQHIPYRGGGPAMTDALGGVFEVFVDSIATAAQQVRAGKLRVICVTSKKRSPIMPEVPTAGELGLPGFETELWNVIMAPRGTPASETEMLRQNVEAVLASPALAERFAQVGAEVVRGSTVEQAKALMKAEVEKWVPVVAANGLKVKAPQ